MKSASEPMISAPGGRFQGQDWPQQRWRCMSSRAWQDHRLL